jgi:hypothetical protein
VAADFTVVLMSIIATMGEDQIGFYALLDGFEPILDALCLTGKEAILERHHFDPGAGGTLQEVGSRTPRLDLARTCATEHAPQNIEFETIIN